MDSLHALIQQLTPGEVRQVRLLASSFRAETDTLKLFEFILAQVSEGKTAYTDFDPQLNGNDLAQRKRQVRELVLKALRSLKSEEDSYTRILAHIQDARMLYKKKLTASSMKALAKAKKLAQRDELYSLLLEILYWEISLTKTNYDTLHLTASLEKEKQEAELIYQEILTYHNILAQFMTLKKTHGFVPPLYYRELDQLMPEERWGTLSTSSQKLEFYQRLSRAYYHFLKKDFSAAYQLLEPIDLKWLSCIDAEELFQALLHKTACGVHNYDIQGSLSVLNELEKSAQAASLEGNLAIQEQCFYYTNNYRLTCNFLLENASEMELLVEQMESYLADSKTQVPIIIRQVLLGNLTQIALYFKDYKKAKRLLNELTTMGKANMRTDVFAAVHYMLPITHLLAGDYDLFENTLRSSLRYLKEFQNAQASRYYPALCAFRKLKNYFDPKARLALCEELTKIAAFPYPGELLPAPKALGAALENYMLRSKPENRQALDYIYLALTSIFIRDFR